MTAHPLARLAPRALTLLVAVVSGAYLLVYLYRWEWNRAVISGIFFVAAEVAFVGSSLRSEVRALGERLAARDAEAERRLATTLGAPHAGRPARPFAWLRESATQGTNVFVPVLLGMGVVFSAVAYLVERVANSVSRATVDVGVARRLAALEPTPQGLLGPRAAAAPPRRHSPWSTRAAWAIAAVVVAVAVGAAIDVIADATQSRPSSDRPPAATQVELRVSQRGDQQPVALVVDALTTACRSTLPEEHRVEPATAVGADTASFRVVPGLGELGRRRFLGCVGDATLDLVEAEVVGVWQRVT